MTKGVSAESIWLSSINSFHARFGEDVVAHFRDGRRLMGHIVSVSPNQKEGHLFLNYARWIHVDDQPLQPGAFLVSAEEIEYIQLIPRGPKHKAVVGETKS